MLETNCQTSTVLNLSFVSTYKKVSYELDKQTCLILSACVTEKQ